jgi:hypothetical protein
MFVDACFIKLEARKMKTRGKVLLLSAALVLSSTTSLFAAEASSSQATWEKTLAAANAQRIP